MNPDRPLHRLLDKCCHE